MSELTATTSVPESVASESVTSTPTTYTPSSAATSCPTMLAALMSKPMVTLSTALTTGTGLGLPPSFTSSVEGLVTSAPSTATTCASPVLPGTKDSDGFLTPPPASTLLLRRTRVNSTGSSTYVIASTTPGSGSPSSSSSNSLFSGIPNPYIPLNPEEANPAGRGGRSTSGRSIRRPKFDDERVVTDTMGRKKDSIGLGLNSEDFVASSLDNSRPDSPLSTDSDRDPGLSPMGVVLDNSGLGCPGLSTMLRDTPSGTGTASSSGKGITIIPKLKVSKGKPASFTTESMAVATMKKQRKEKAPEKHKNVDPRTGKRRYIKKKDFRRTESAEGPIYGRTVSQSSDFSAAPSEREPILTWRPQDDLRLLINVKQTCDLKMVHAGIEFSCDFKLEHIKARWNAMLYDPNVSKVSQMAINNLHSKVRAEIYAKALYSKEEDDLIRTVKSTFEKSTVLLKLEELLNSNALIFVKWRTPEHLFQHWKDLKEFHLLCDQNVKDYFANESFADVEETMNDSEILTNSLDNAVYQEVLIENKHMRKKIRLAEEELVPWKIMAEAAADVVPTNGEESSYAMLRGEKVRYLMRSREITLGRWTETNGVDVDLALEGPTYKVSRRQAVIQLKSTGEFLFFNQGKHAMFLDGEALLPKHMGRLRDQSVIQISGLKFTFLVNEKMVGDLKKRLTENSRGSRLELNSGHSGFTNSTGRIPPPRYPGIPPPYTPHLMSLTRPRQIQTPQARLGGKKGFQFGIGSGVLTRGPILASQLFQIPHPSRTPGAIGIGLGIGRPGFPVLASPTLTPTIFRRSASSAGQGQGHSDPIVQSSFQFGDLTIRPGAPPPPQS